MTTQATTDTEKTSQIIESIMKNGTPIYQIKGLTKDHMEALYSYGYNLYNSGKFSEAEKIFLALCIYDHTTQKYWMAHGGSCQAQKAYDRALASYSFAALLDAKNPMPALRGFECHAAMKNYMMALAALEAVIYIAGNEPKYAEVKKKAEQLRSAMEAAAGEKKEGA